MKHVEDVEREGRRVTLAESVEGLYEYSPVPNIYKYDLGHLIGHLTLMTNP